MTERGRTRHHLQCGTSIPRTERGENPKRHLGGFAWVLQANAYAGYDKLFADGRLVEAACWAHYLEFRFMRSSWPCAMGGRG